MQDLRGLAPELCICGFLAVVAGVPALTAWWCLQPKPLWPKQRQRAVPWTALEIACVFVVVLLWPALVLRFLNLVILGLQEQPTQVRGVVVAQVAASPFVLAAVLGIPWFTSGARAYQLGLTAHRAGWNLVAGYLTWLVLTPAVLAVHLVSRALYRAWTEKPPEDHPLVRLARERPSDLTWALVILSGVVIAPVLEELVFRGLLQPWLTRRTLAPRVVVVLTFLLAMVSGEKHGVGPAVFVLVAYVLFPLADRVAWRWLPSHGVGHGIWATSLLFAAFHSAAWPAPIPLFILGLGLGFLSYRTQSLVGPIGVHALFNSLGVLTLLLIQAAGDGGAAKGREVTSARSNPAAVSACRTVPGS